MKGRAEFNTHRFTIGLLPNFLGISSSLSNGCPPCCTLETMIRRRRSTNDCQKALTASEITCFSFHSEELSFAWTAPLARDSSFYLSQRSNCLFIQRVDRTFYIVKCNPSGCCYLL
ncbi:uncharacterized protein LOC131311332 isoform X4 [Rhododendron vialii]|uniref:uncharacterized protein LOC131311332 isoform X4 n=1 Tax=Rhododendron vialii TaxID=182163 RepID=UPI00265DDB74|nr:uncharacterized protein LOC131311332 isoform X4 [Rhododendron vialii]